MDVVGGAVLLALLDLVKSLSNRIVETKEGFVKSRSGLKSKVAVSVVARHVGKLVGEFWNRKI